MNSIFRMKLVLYMQPQTSAKLKNTKYLAQVLNKKVHTTSIKLLFYEKSPKGEYDKPDPEKPKLSKELIRHGLKQIKEEIQIWKSEVRSAWEGENLMKGIPGVVDKVFIFKDENDLSQWVVTSDKDNSEGESTCELSINTNEKGVFTGNLSLNIPKDGRINRTGYCNMRTLRAMKSFQREAFYDWGMYTHLVMRVRGDGRSYALNLSTSGYFDLSWNDIYTYVLFTRGGPYWQYSRIPFSKFFFTSKGRIQDEQFPVPLSSITSFGITLAERASGPFHLEIDYIGLEFDPSHSEEFAYEMYKIPEGTVSS